MTTVTIESLCSGLQNKAGTSHFLEHPVDDIEHEANHFVAQFAEDHGLKAHTLGALRWYFQSDEGLVEDGLIELQCKLDSMWKRGHCEFEFVNVADIDLSKKAGKL